MRVINHPPPLGRWYGYGWYGLLLLRSDGWPSFFVFFFLQLVHHAPGKAIAPPRRPRNVITDREQPAETKAFWEHEARRHDEKQPAIVDLIVEVFRQNPTLSFDAAAAHAKIGNWCSGNTIGNLFRSLRYSRTWSVFFL